MNERPNTVEGAPPLADERNGGRTSNPKQQTPVLPMDVRVQLADLAGIPQQERDQFYDLIQMPVRLVWKLDRRAFNEDAGADLIRVAEAARDLHEAFANLNPGDREWIEYLNTTGIEFYHFLPALPRTVRLLERLFSIAVGKAPLYNASRPKKAGRRRGAIKDLAFLEVVRWLLIVAEECCGGHLTLDKNYENGTLIDALDLLRPHLPKGVIPKQLPLGTIQTTKDNQHCYAGYPDIYPFDPPKRRLP
jgi:hypothetical protein